MIASIRMGVFSDGSRPGASPAVLVVLKTLVVV